MPKRDNLEFRGGAATNTEGEQGNQGRKNRDHAHDGMAAPQKSLGSSAIRSLSRDTCLIHSSLDPIFARAHVSEAVVAILGPGHFLAKDV
jgi:hypothetical protein